MAFGDRVKAARLKKRMTMTEVEHKAGLKIGNISRIERGGQWVSESSLHAIAKALEVPVASLFIEDARENPDGPPEGYIRFQRFDVAASAGPGAEPVAYPEVVNELDVLESWVYQRLGVSDPRRVNIITCKGDSMTPTIQPGDIVFVDTAVNYFQAEGIYVLIWNGQLLLKRLCALFDGRLAIKSDNDRNYKTEYVTQDTMENLAICGKVAGWWSYRRS